MSLTTVAILLCAVGALVTARLSWIFFQDPEAGLLDTTHRAEQLPQVMTDRYVAMTFLAIAAAIYGDPLVIVVLFISFSFMGFADALIYRRAGHPIVKHVAAGAAALIVVVVALFAHLKNGAA